MGDRLRPGGSELSGRPHPGSDVAALLLFGAVTARALLLYLGGSNLPIALGLLVAVAVVFASEPPLTKRIGWYRYLYFPLQATPILLIGALRPFLDISAGLFVVPCLTAIQTLPRRPAIGLIGLSVVAMATTMVVGAGWADGLGLSLVMLVGGALYISFDWLYRQQEAARAESQELLEDLRESYDSLEIYAARVDELSRAQEHDALARELHDSVGQSIFAIRLTAEAALLLMRKNPSGVPEQLRRLQDLTADALGRMRALLAEWRSGEVAG